MEAVLTNGADKVLDKINRILEQDNKMSTRVGLQLSLELSSENHRLLTQLLSEVKQIKNRSWGNWAYQNPKRAVAFFVAISAFYISDVRDPVVQLLSDWVQRLFMIL